MPSIWIALASRTNGAMPEMPEAARVTVRDPVLHRRPHLALEPAAYLRHLCPPLRLALRRWRVRVLHREPVAGLCTLEQLGQFLPRIEERRAESAWKRAIEINHVETTLEAVSLPPHIEDTSLNRSFAFVSFPTNLTSQR
jgi:hypothetical protein